jgi:hypothetical protein
LNKVLFWIALPAARKDDFLRFGADLLKTAESVRHESAIILAAERAVEKVLTQHISYPALDMLQ